VSPAALTSEQRLERFDQKIEELKQGFVDAAVALERSPEVDSSFEERWRDIEERTRDLRRDLQQEDYDKEQLAELYDALLDTRDLLDQGAHDLDVLDALLVCVERVRHVVRDALDEHVSGIADDKGLVVGDLLDALPHVSRETIAELVGVDRRTLNRWKDASGRPSPRLRAVARLVAILKHNWTEEGVVAWFHRPRRQLDGAKPITLLGARAVDEDALVMAARAGRSQYAT
jgi:uncharacterized protein (DUF2384 family)